MAQFDVHRNPGRNREIFPFVVVVQSSRYDAYSSRVVAPLMQEAAARAITNKRFNPSFIIQNKVLILHPLEVTAVPISKLGPAVESLASYGDTIMAALDELITQVNR